ncbi:hypothetical protein C2G38_2152425 [Gigaspora rosea]|uniref:Uncharacterized protein n=1 Tax=Gigaspora rosea TaxID=44941 RepID=A0A397W714_9GLOM|nr:hypothetical protein C2G38_2152425 [Gigaspora rosea]
MLKVNSKKRIRIDPKDLKQVQRSYEKGEGKRINNNKKKKKHKIMKQRKANEKIEELMNTLWGKKRIKVEMKIDRGIENNTQKYSIMPNNTGKLPMGDNDKGMANNNKEFQSGFDPNSNNSTKKMSH